MFFFVIVLTHTASNRLLSLRAEPKHKWCGVHTNFPKLTKFLFGIMTAKQTRDRFHEALPHPARLYFLSSIK